MKNIKNRKIYLVIAGLFLCSAGIPSSAQEKSKEEQQLEASAGELNKKNSKGRTRVINKIKEQYGVDEARLLGLHFRKLRYGEIAIVLGLAQDARGDIKDEDLQKIVALRQGPPVAGWGKVAGDLGLKLGPVISKVRLISAEVRKLELTSKVNKDNKAAGAKAKRNESPKTLKKPVKAEPPEQPERSWKEKMRSFMRS